MFRLKDSFQKFVIPTLLVCLFSLLAACAGGNGGSDSENGSQLEIAVIPKGTAHVFWLAVHAGAETAGKELGVEILWQGPQTETMKDQQRSIVSDFIVRGVDGVVLAPLDQDAMVPAVQDLARSNIPCVIFDSGVNTDEYVSFVATDNYKGGVEAAHEMAKLLNKKGTCIITRVDPGSQSTNQREKGFEDTLKSDYPDIEIVDSQYGYSDRDKSRAVTEDMLTAHPDVDAIFGPNESSTFGALLALQALNLAGQKNFVGFDSSAELIEGLRNKEIQALVLQDPFKMGYEGVHTLVKHFNGEEVSKNIDTGVYVATPENMDDPEISRLLSPDLSILEE